MSKPYPGDWRTRRVPGVVTPGLAGFGLVVPELGAGIDLALVPLWQKGFVEVERRVAHRLAFLARFQRRRQVARVHASPVDVAVLEHIGIVGGVLLGPGAQGEGRGVLQQFQAAAWYGKGRATGFAHHPFTVIDQSRDAGVFAGGIAYPIIETEVPVRGIDRHLVRSRVQLEQGFLPVGQILAVLRQVGRGNHEQRFFRPGTGQWDGCRCP